MNLLTVTFICSLMCCTINCQYPWGGDGSYPGYQGYGGGYPGSGGCNGFAGMLSYLLGGNRCCGGGCGGGAPVVYYPVPLLPGPNPPCPPETTTTAPLPTCSVTIDQGPFHLWICDQTFNPATVIGCPSSRVTFQLVAGIPSLPFSCTSIDSFGVVRFNPVSGGCAVGPGIVYMGNLTARDSWTGATLATSSIQIDTSMLSCYGTTTATGATTTSTAATTTAMGATTPPACSVSYTLSTSQNNGNYHPIYCQEQFLTPDYISCPFYRLSYQLSNLPCAEVRSDGALIVNVNNPGCDVNSGIPNYGVMTITDSFTGYQLGVYYIQMYLENLGYCKPTTTTATTTTTS
ncbi:uncharacterized protein LOC129595561 [Paramacrobiotus metropolitanus]|uniref:uncharacterized protein LOC129595561 n=1 Tax=Paramacrobiotus metropolitanus TaxID=2943436 RepID=UPI002446298B|nr:uncharacterized protein LOC129595561 [Paramacrobiotus metropolitanus]